MEQIINFLEQYWGYTIVGGVTFGTLITFIVTQIKSLLSSKLKDAKLGEQSKTVEKLMTKCEDLCTELNVKELEKQELYKQLELEQKKSYKQLELEQKKALVKEQYFEQVQASTFKAIAFLITASKLPNEDKIALQKEFDSIVKPTFETYVEEVKEIVLPTVEEVKEVKEDTVAVVEETIKKTKSLLDKYTGA